jgi:uncharacterized 2Fe-2S/4Fe-4S cluster protein (DUF4445 family)
MPASLNPAASHTHQVDFEPAGRRVSVPEGTNLLDAARQAGVEIVSSCGGIGICGTCTVKLISGRLSPVTPMEEDTLTQDELAAGLRLACQAEPLSQVRLDVPQESLLHTQKMQVEGIESEHSLDPAVIALDISLPAGQRNRQAENFSFINAELAQRGYPPLSADPGLIQQLTRSLITSDGQARIVIRPAAEQSELVAVLPSAAPIFGLAMDIGSTKIAMYLVDLTSGGTLKAFAVMNPQIAYGEDVISRISYANRGEAERKLLQTLLVDGINTAVAEQLRLAGLTSDQIVDVVAVGNTAIHHFFCGLPVEQLGRAPFSPAVAGSLSLPAAQIGLRAAPGARVYLPPNIAGYVGADHVSALVASQPYFADGASLLVDIGTNTEISLVNGQRILSCSCASGPAFEGAHITDGMRAAPGAIDRITFRDGRPVVYTIEEKPAVGICGSGILNSLAEMLNAGVLDRRGLLTNQTGGKRGEYILVDAAHSGHGRNIVINRRDVNEIQLAKAAIRGGMRTLQDAAGMGDQAVQSFVAAGAFGTHLDTASAVRTGMFPDIPRERFHQVGNAAGVGARQMLLSRAKRQEAEEIVSRVEYLELTIMPQFTPFYTEEMFFPEK